MKLIVIGAVAAGTAAAAKASRNNEDMEIIIYERDTHISYSGCGTPYYLGRHFSEVEDIAPRNPEHFKKSYGIDIKIRHEVLKIDPSTKKVTVKNLMTNEVFEDSYDKLILATGARAFVPPIKGSDLKHVFSLRNVNNMLAIESYIKENKVKKTAIIGSGFIGLELAENFKEIGLDVALLEKLPQVSPNIDEDMAKFVEEKLIENDIRVMTNTNIVEITKEGVVLDTNEVISAELVIVATGVRPNVELAKEIGIELGVSGAIKVNDYMETNIKDIYAAGDSVELTSIVSDKPIYLPLGSTANKTGRVAGDNVSGGKMKFKGVVGTAIYRIFDLAVAQTGLTEKQAKNLGYDVIISKDKRPHRTDFFDVDYMNIKMIANKEDGRVLGVQIVGGEGVDKRVDVVATVLTFKGTIYDLSQLDLAYSPIYNTARDPLNQTGMILEGKINKK